MATFWILSALRWQRKVPFIMMYGRVEWYLSICLSVFLSVCLFVCLFFCLSPCLPVYLSIHPSTFLFLPHVDVICDLLLNRRTATWNLFVELTLFCPQIYIVKRSFNFAVWLVLLISGIHETKNEYKLTDCRSF